MIRPMRGQAVIRETQWERSFLWTPRPSDRETKWYRGRVLALGSPARLTDTIGAPEVPWDFAVGDEVVYTFVHNMGAFTQEWEDGKPASWVPQGAIVGVWCSPSN